MRNDTRLRTAVQIAMLRAAAVTKEQRERRFDVDAYQCQKDGSTWLAFGPDGGIYQFARDGESDVLCISSSGHSYTLSLDAEACRHRCNCPDSARERTTGCKHEVAWQSVRNTHRANKSAQLAKAA